MICRRGDDILLLFRLSLAISRLELCVEVARFLKRVDIKVDGPSRDRVGKAIVNDLLDEGNILRNKLADSGGDCGWEAVECAKILVEMAFPERSIVGEDGVFCRRYFPFFDVPEVCGENGVDSTEELGGLKGPACRTGNGVHGAVQSKDPDFEYSLIFIKDWTVDELLLRCEPLREAFDCDSICGESFCVAGVLCKRLRGIFEDAGVDLRVLCLVFCNEMLLSCPLDDLERYQGLKTTAIARCRGANLVIDIGHVLHKENFIAEVVPHDTTQNIGGEIVSGVAKVPSIIDGWTTAVPCHFPACRVDRDKWGFRFGE